MQLLRQWAGAGVEKMSLALVELRPHGLADARRYAGVDFHALGIGQEKARAGPVGNVLNVHQWQPLGAEALEQFRCLQARLRAARQALEPGHE